MTRRLWDLKAQGKIADFKIFYSWYTQPNVWDAMLLLRFDAFAGLPHYPFPGGQLLRVPFSALGAWYYSLRDRLGI